MIRNNLFEGDSYFAIFARISYKKLMTREWMSNADIMAESLGLKSANDLKCPISKCDHVKELTKALSALRSCIGEDQFEEKGNNRDKRVRYIGDDDDPLADMKNAKVVKDLHQYMKFIRDSAGFFPSSWLDYFFKDTQDLVDIKVRKRNGEQVIRASLDRELTNIDLLPMLYEAIVNKQVLEIDYKPYEEEVSSLTFHPHCLKENNGRWFMLGHAEGRDPENGFNIALDRIQGRPRPCAKAKYRPAPHMYYDNLFKDIVGVTFNAESPVYNIVVRAHTYYIYRLIETKPIHKSQTKKTDYGRHEDGEYGEVEIKVRVNNELLGRISQMGEHLEVMSPPEVREMMAKKVKKMAERYQK